MFDFGCSFSLVTAKDRRKCRGSVIDLNTDGSYLLVSPGLVTMVGSSKRSPQTPRGVQRDGGEGVGEGGGGWGASCWRTPPLGDSVSCHWGPVEGTAYKSTSRSCFEDVCNVCVMSYVTIHKYEIDLSVISVCRVCSCSG